jgi:pimeloyl-ACP methyl ester carboxylesterase
MNLMIWRSKLILCGLIFLLFAACQSTKISETQTSLPTLTPTIRLSPTPESTMVSDLASSVTSPPTEDVVPEFTVSPEPELADSTINKAREEIEASDGLILVGTYYAPIEVPPPWPGVILLHMLGSDRSSWDDYARQLTSAGYAVFALDMRGHGDTGGAVDWNLAGNDIQQVWNNLSTKKNIDPDRMALVGASIGANMALAAGSNEAGVRTVVLLSPGLDYAGVTTEAAMVAYGDRPVLIVASQEDTYAANSSRSLEEVAIGEARLVKYQNAGHGTHMLASETGLGELIIEWLDAYLE